jgi:fatty-acyl-CoA synthase
MKTTYLVRAAVILSLTIPLYFAAAALGVKFGLWHWRFGLGTLIAEWGPRLLGAAVIVAMLALLAALLRRPRHGVSLAVIALLIPALGLGYLYQVRARSKTIPPIHDVATSVEDPPVHSPRLAAERAAADANPVHPLTAPLSSIKAYQAPRFARQANRTVGQLGQEAYPQLRPLVTAADRQRLFGALQNEARERGWRIVTSDPAAGRLEAVAETFWFGFQDDVVIRVRPAQTPGSLIVDARSTSRVGLSDLGANAKRLTDYLHSVEQELGTRS